MPSHGGATTRRGRYLWLCARSTLRERYYRYAGWRWDSFPTTPRRVKTGRKWILPKGPKIYQRLKKGKRQGHGGWPLLYDLWIHTLESAEYQRPPIVKLLASPTRDPVYYKRHFPVKHVAYHIKPQIARGKPPRNKRYTAFNLRVSGSNWFYLRNQYYSDNDVLARRPNETDYNNGEPLGPPGWPVPLGYQT